MDIQFHLLDTVARDICVEAEDETTRQISYEPPEQSDSEGEPPKRRYTRVNATERKEFIIQLYGLMENGKKVQVDVVGFRPTLYLALPSSKTLAAIDAKVPVILVTTLCTHST